MMQDVMQAAALMWISHFVLEDAPFKAWHVDGLEGGFVLLGLARLSSSCFRRSRSSEPLSPLDPLKGTEEDGYFERHEVKHLPGNSSRPTKGVEVDGLAPPGRQQILMFPIVEEHDDNGLEKGDVADHLRHDDRDLNS